MSCVGWMAIQLNEDHIMFIDPKTAIENNWITHPECNTLQDWIDRKYLGPNAIDFTLDQLYSINHHNLFTISEDTKQMRGGELLGIANTDAEGNEYWTLSAHETYDGMSSMTLDLPVGVACQLVIRSTFNRNGIYLTSGLYDSKFQGACGFALHNRSGLAMVQKGVRVGQIIFVSSSSDREYAGGWNHAAGTHWSETNE